MWKVRFILFLLPPPTSFYSFFSPASFSFTYIKPPEGTNRLISFLCVKPTLSSFLGNIYGQIKKKKALDLSFIKYLLFVEHKPNPWVLAATVPHVDSEGHKEVLNEFIWGKRRRWWWWKMRKIIHQWKWTLWQIIICVQGSWRHLSWKLCIVCQGSLYKDKWPVVKYICPCFNLACTRI